MEPLDDDIAACVWLAGDPSPLCTTITPQQLLARVADIEFGTAEPDLAFVTVPLAGGREAFVRPRAITLIGPPDLAGLDDDDVADN